MDLLLAANLNALGVVIRAAGNAQRRRRVKSPERLPPECFGSRRIPALQPINEIAVGSRLRKFQVVTAAERFVKPENFVQQGDNGAAIKQ